MTVRMSMLISQGKNGKTESFYSALGVPQALEAGKLLAAKRSLIMTPAATIFDIVVRDVDNPRVSAVTDASWFENGKRPTAETGDVHNAAALCRYTAGRHSAKPWLHAMPDDFIQGTTVTGAYYLTATAVGLIDAYLSFLRTQNAWSLRGLDQSTLTPPAFRVANITTPGGVVTLTVPGATYVAGDRIVVTGPKGFRVRQFAGFWSVVSNTAGALVVSAFKPLDLSFFYEGNSAKVRKVGYEYPSISATQTIKAGTRKMGRIPNVPPGRRSVRH